MTSEQFAYWLQGFVELNGHMPNEAQWQSIKEHLSTVFKKVTPPINSGGVIPYKTEIERRMNILRDELKPPLTMQVTC